MAKFVCLLDPGFNETKLSGLYICSNSYTAIAPDGSGRLYIAAKKDGCLGSLAKA